MAETLKSYDADDSNNFKTIVVFDCRGFVPVEFQFLAGWCAKGEESGTNFKVDLKENVSFLMIYLTICFVTVLLLLLWLNVYLYSLKGMGRLWWEESSKRRYLWAWTKVWEGLIPVLQFNSNNTKTIFQKCQLQENDSYFCFRSLTIE